MVKKDVLFTKLLLRMVGHHVTEDLLSGLVLTTLFQRLPRSPWILTKPYTGFRRVHSPPTLFVHFFLSKVYFIKITF